MTISLNTCRALVSILALAGAAATSSCNQPAPDDTKLRGTAVTPVASAQPAALPPGMSAGLKKHPGYTTGYIDVLGATADPAKRQPVTVPASSSIIISGFALDSKALARGVDIAIDGVPYATQYGSDRPDVGKYFKDPTLDKSGFRTTLPAGSVAVGAHKLTLRVISADGATYYERDPISFEIR